MINMATAVFPGSFDPVTLGHMDLIERAAKMFDRLVVGVLNNSGKDPLFSMEERVYMLKELVCTNPHIEVKAFDGLLAEIPADRVFNEGFCPAGAGAGYCPWSSDRLGL